MCIRDRLTTIFGYVWLSNAGPDLVILAVVIAGEYLGVGLGTAAFIAFIAVSYTHLRAHETPEHLVCRLLLEKKKQTNNKNAAICTLQKKR